MYLVSFEEDLLSLIIQTFQGLDVDYWDPQQNIVTNNKPLKKYIQVHQNTGRLRVLLRQYVNLGMKFLPAQNWKIKKSSKLKDTQGKPYRDELDFFIEQAISGNEIKGFQSKKSLCAYDEDALLNCWSIHHVHLSKELESNGEFYKRSDWLLMLHQTRDTLYLIDVIPHKDFDEDPITLNKVNLSFSRKKIFEILVRDFPYTMEKWRLNGVLGVKNKLSDFEIRSARKSGLMVSVTVDGEVYTGGFGIASSTSGMQSTIQASNYNRMIYDWNKHIDDNWKTILKDLNIQPDVVKPAIFRLTQNEKGFVVLEQRSNTFIRSFSEHLYFRRKRVPEK
jgi:hypothetical protein